MIATEKQKTPSDHAQLSYSPGIWQFRVIKKYIEFMYISFKGTFAQPAAVCCHLNAALNLE